MGTVPIERQWCVCRRPEVADGEAVAAERLTILDRVAAPDGQRLMML
jgi:hypothetical protein